VPDAEERFGTDITPSMPVQAEELERTLPVSATPSQTVTPPTQMEIQAEPVDEVVYVTNTGDKYHRAGCRYLRRSSNPLPLSQAMRGYSACSVCY